MSSTQKILGMLFNVVKSRLFATAGVTMISTGSYVSYKDRTRYPRIFAAFRHGAILAPLRDNHLEMPYMPRDDLEQSLDVVLGPQFTNQYYLINGEVGAGKTRTIVELVKRQVHEANGKGAPIYVLASQGKCLPESLAEAINFSFDEHINFKFFLDYMLGVHAFPSKDEHNKLQRVLDAIEKAAFHYAQTEGRPVVIVIDGVNSLGRIQPSTLGRLQEKAKLWADCNIVKLVLVSNDEQTEELLQQHSSNWSRAAAPITVDDLNQTDAIRFLTRPVHNEDVMDIAKHDDVMDLPTAHVVYRLVGGRVQHLLAFRRDRGLGVAFSNTTDLLKAKEREKFLHLKRCSLVGKAVELVQKAQAKSSDGGGGSGGGGSSGGGDKEGGVFLEKLVRETSHDTVWELARANIVKFERSSRGVYVMFESKLTEAVVNEFVTLAEGECVPGHGAHH